MEPKEFGKLSSSVDPAKLSTTVQSAARVVSGLLVFTGVLTVVDATTLLAHVNALLVDVVGLVPLAYSAYHTAEAIFGLLRKAVVAYAKR